LNNLDLEAAMVLVVVPPSVSMLLAALQRMVVEELSHESLYHLSYVALGVGGHEDILTTSA
jgi:hypothetical protein